MGIVPDILVKNNGLSYEKFEQVIEELRTSLLSQRSTIRPLASKSLDSPAGD